MDVIGVYYTPSIFICLSSVCESICLICLSAKLPVNLFVHINKNILYNYLSCTSCYFTDYIFQHYVIHGLSQNSSPQFFLEEEERVGSTGIATVCDVIVMLLKVDLHVLTPLY